MMIPCGTFCIGTMYYLIVLYCMYIHMQVNDVHVVKSGTDFKELSEITVEFSVNKPSYTIQRHEITSDLAENEEVAAIVSKYLGI